MIARSSPLPAGAKAPDFTLQRATFQSFSLRDVPGPAALVFYPGDWEPVSGEQLQQYQKHLGDLSLYEVTLVAISTDSVWSHAAYRRHLKLSFPLLADVRPTGSVARAYGVFDEGQERSGRAIFVIDAGRTVLWSSSWPVNLNPGVEGILRALSNLDGTRAPPGAAM